MVKIILAIKRKANLLISFSLYVFAYVKFLQWIYGSSIRNPLRYLLELRSKYSSDLRYADYIELFSDYGAKVTGNNTLISSKKISLASGSCLYKLYLFVRVFVSINYTYSFLCWF